MTHNYISFFAATLVLLVTPGPAVFFVVARSLAQGVKAGITSVAGLATGGMVQVLLASAGLSAILAASHAAFTSVRYAGTAYLIALGIFKLFEKPERREAKNKQPKPLKKLFWQGFFVQILNPKVALFFLSFLPQFVNVKKGHAALQMMAFGMVFVGLAFITDSMYALAAGRIGQTVKDSSYWQSASWQKISQGLSALTYIALGIVSLLWTEN